MSPYRIMTTLRFALAAAAALLSGWPAFAADVPDHTVTSADAAAPAVRVTLPGAGIVPPASDTPSLPPIELTAPVSLEAAPVMGRIQPLPVDPVVETLDGPIAPKYKDLWERMRAGFTLNEIDSQLVARHEAWYLNRPEYVQRMIERSHRYLYFIVEELEKRNMPTEIALLPMIESAYNPQAYSRARASGIWQFIPSTGRRYGLQQNFWYDGRRDVLAATRAALDYLQFLHDRFDDWELALAAYNWGENGVQRAVVKNRSRHKATNYASLKMPKETRNYLPKLQAVKNIISNPRLLGFELDSVPNQPYFAVVKAPGHIDVLKAAQLADMPVEEFRSLNPGYNRPVIIQAAARQIVLPIDKVDGFHANLESNDDPLVTWQTYTLKNGETLDKVAAKFGTSVFRLREVNGFNGRKRVRPGQMVLVPLETEAGPTNLDETYNSADFQASPEEYSAARTYRVRRGDTLSSIARRHHVTVARIKAVNALKSNSVHAGQQLVIYGDARPARRAHRHRHVHRISSN
jgi:membrane-bound lytic murein transglycosylase D